MKLLFDQNLSFKLCGRLEDLFPGSNQVRQLHLDEADDRNLPGIMASRLFRRIRTLRTWPRCMVRRPKQSHLAAMRQPAQRCH
ncbi:MAG: DUF5615 family PIN-like protein [Verrucomicrobiota bacterium]